MSLELLETALNEYESVGGAVTLDKVQTPAQFDQVKSRLDLVVPQEFDELYSAYSCVEFGPIELVPIDRLLDCYDAFHRTFSSLTPDYVPFIADDAGGFFIIAFGETRDQGSEFGTVFYVPPSNPPELEYRSSNLFSFLERWVRQRIDFAK